MSPQRSRPFGVLLASSLALTLAACSAGENGQAEPAAGGDAAADRSGGAVTIAASAGPGCLDPQQLALAITMTVGRQLTVV